MSSKSPHEGSCVQGDLVLEYALGALDASALPAIEAHIQACSECRQQAETAGRIVGSFAYWPTDLLRPSPSLWERVAGRIAEAAGSEPLPRTARPWAQLE